MAERTTCSLQENQASAAKYKITGKDYGPADVIIESVNTATNTVQFVAKGVLIECTWTKNNVMADCPSTLNASMSTLPQVRDEGVLYLSAALIAKHNLGIKVKWPDAYATRPEYRPLSIWPTAIRIEGKELATGDMISATIDVHDPMIAEPGQSIVIGRGALHLKVSQDAAGTFLVPWTTLERLATAIDEVNGDQHDTTARGRATAWRDIADWQDLLKKQGESTLRADKYAAARELLKKLRPAAR